MQEKKINKATLKVTVHLEGFATGQLLEVFPWFFLGFKANSGLELKFHVSRHASYVALTI